MSAATDKMLREDLLEAAVETRALRQAARAPGRGMVAEADIEPLDDVPALDELPEGDPQPRSGRWCSSSTAASARAWE